MAWRDRVTAALACATDFCLESQKPSPVVHPIAHAPVILSSSDHSTVPRSPQTMECDRCSNWQVSRTIVLPFSWWTFGMANFLQGFFVDRNAIATNQMTQKLYGFRAKQALRLARPQDALVATDKKVHPVLAGAYPSPSYKQSSHQYSSRHDRDLKEASSFRDPTQLRSCSYRMAFLGINNIHLPSQKLFCEYPHPPLVSVNRLCSNQSLTKIGTVHVSAQILRFRHRLRIRDGNLIQLTVINTNTVRSIIFLHYHQRRRIQ